MQETGQDWPMLVAALAESRELQQGPEKKGEERGGVRVDWSVQKWSIHTQHLLPLFVKDV